MTIMKNIYVNKIIEHSHMTVGYVLHDETIKENFGVLFSPSDINILYNHLKGSPDGGHTFEKFCQFVVYIELGKVGWIMKVIDFHEKTDNAIDEYSELLKVGWDKESRDAMFCLFQEIEKDKENVGEMVIRVV